MIEVLKEFLLFGVVENFIIFLFVKSLTKREEIKYKHLFVIYLFSNIFVILNFPYVKQIFATIMFATYFKIVLKEKYITCLKLSAYGILYLLVIETIYFLIVELFFNLDGSTCSVSTKFLLFIPCRIIEILIPIFYKKPKENIRWVHGGGVK